MINFHNISKDAPYKKFLKYYDLAKTNKQNLIEAISISSFSKKYNEVNSRYVNLKYIRGSEWIFFTNYDSKKGESIKKNKNVCLSFFWPSLEKQLIINGICSKISGKDSDDYFYSRPLDSQIGALSSNQSKEIPNRQYIEEKFERIKKSKVKIKRPINWGGFFVEINEFEFWQGRSNRLHDRIVFSKSKNNSWEIKRLSP